MTGLAAAAIALARLLADRFAVDLLLAAFGLGHRLTRGLMMPARISIAR